MIMTHTHAQGGRTTGAVPRQRTGGRLRVLSVVHRFLPELGGTETHVAEVTRRLVHQPDLELTVLTTDRSGDLPPDEVVDGVRVLRKSAWPRERDYYFSPDLVQAVECGPWDVVHFQGVHTLVPPMGMRAARRARMPYVLTFHSGGHSSAGRVAARGPQFRVLTPLLRGADRLIAVSRFERRRVSELTGIPPESFTVIGNGGALPPVATGVTPVPGRIVSSGRLERYKGHHLAIEALPAVRDRIPGAELVILGAGPYEGELRALAERLGVREAVTIRHVPPGDRAAMARELAGSTVMAALSSYEAHPVSVMEAVSIGLPVVGFDVAGVSDLVADGLVAGVPMGSPSAVVAERLVRALSTERPAGPRVGVELPTWDHCADRLAQVYREVAYSWARPMARAV
jgi:glycosyltransferase involved in cell wall biosynthesis